MARVAPLPATLQSQPTPLAATAAFHHATALWLQPGGGDALCAYGPSAVQFTDDPPLDGTKPRVTSFPFPLVLPAGTPPKVVYSLLLQPLLRHVVAGRNAAVFGYDAPLNLHALGQPAEEGGLTHLLALDLLAVLASLGSSGQAGA